MKMFSLFVNLLFVFVLQAETISVSAVDTMIRSYIDKEDQVDVEIRDTKLKLAEMGNRKDSVLFLLYEKNKDNLNYADAVMALFLQEKRLNLYTDANIKKIAREILEARTNKLCVSAVRYLAIDGEQQDINLLVNEAKKVTSMYERKIIEKAISILSARVAGTNLIQGVVAHDIDNWSLTTPRFIPSVANTGPQAEFLFQRIKEELAKANGDVKKLPSELLTLTIPPPQPVVERFKENGWLIGVGVLLLAGIGVLVFRKTRKP